MSKSSKWSYSRWSMFHRCQAQYDYAYIQRLPRHGTSAALERGLAIHKKAEEFVKGNITGMPDELAKFAKEFKVLRKEYKAGNGFTEIDVSIDSNWQRSNMRETDYLIGFADFVHFEEEAVTIIDYKTGRQYPSHRDQAHVYAMACMCSDEDIQEAQVEFWYLDHSKTQSWNWPRKQLEQMKTVWKKRVDKMINCKNYEARPNNLCKWCDYSASKGGPCEHG